MRALLAIATYMLLTACDPGWTYHVSAARAQHGEPVPSPADSQKLSLELLEAQLFTYRLYIRVAVRNASTEGLVLDSASLQAFDRRGDPLTPWLTGGCAIGYPTAHLPTCSPWRYFVVEPITWPYTRNPALREITVHLRGTVRGGQNVLLTLPLEWDK